MSMTDGREYRMHSGNMAAFRRAEEKDLAALCAIEERCFGTPWSETTLKEMLESPLDLVFMAELPDMPGEEGHTAGYLNFRVIAGEGELMRVAVLPEQRGCGNAAGLMEEMMAAAETMGVSDITLEVRASNVPALKLYDRFGFKAEAVRKNYYDHPQEDAVIEWRRG